MSLINDALKEAQRERSDRAGAKAAANPVDNFFPYPSSKKNAPAQTNYALIVGAGVVMVAAIVFAIVRIRGTGSPRPLGPVGNRVPAATPAPAIPAPAATADSSRSTDATKAVPTGGSAAGRGIAAATPSSGVAARESKNKNDGLVRDHQVAAAPVVTSGANVAARKAAPDSATPAPAAPIAPPKPIASAPNNMRIVADPSTARAGDSLFARAYAEHVRGNLDAAADLYEKAIQHPPVAPELYNNYGALLARRGNYNAAVSMYNMALGANRSDPKVWINLGDAYHALGRRADAISDYFEAAKLDPANAAVKVSLAAEYQAIGDTATARRTFEDALATHPKDARTHYAFAAFLINQQDYRSAARELQSFVDLGAGQVPQADIDSAKNYLTKLRSQIR